MFNAKIYDLEQANRELRQKIRRWQSEKKLNRYTYINVGIEGRDALMINLYKLGYVFEDYAFKTSDINYYCIDHKYSTIIPLTDLKDIAVEDILFYDHLPPIFKFPCESYKDGKEKTMTLSQIEKELGYKVKIVSDE